MRRIGIAVVCLYVGTGALASGAAAACPNEAIRAEQSAQDLPECRAYEQVSPVDKGNEDVAYNGSVTHSSNSGDRLAYGSNNAFPGSFGTAAIAQYIARRGPDGWTTLPITPKQAPFPIGTLGGAYYQDYDAELTRGLVRANNPPLTPDATPGIGRVYTRLFQGPGDPYDYVGALGMGGTWFAGATADLGHIVLNTSEALTPDTPEDFQSHVYVAGPTGLELVSILPSGESPSDGAVAAEGLLESGDAIGPSSENGLRTAFLSGSAFVSSAYGAFLGGHLYLRVRDDGTPYTLDVSGSQRSVPGESEPAVFWDISADGSKVVFMSGEKLTDDATSASGAFDLYRFDTDTGQLSDLTTGDPDGAKVAGLMGASRDGSVLYFAAAGALTPDAPANGLPKLYVWRESEGVDYVTTLTGADIEQANWQTGVSQALHSRATPDGSRLLFVTAAELTPTPTNEHQTVYIYDAVEDRIICASCDPDGAAVSADATVHTERAAQPRFRAKPRILSEDGSRAFFNTRQSLAPEDTNGKVDVYMYVDGNEGEPGGVRLISSGAGSYDSVFADASPSGRDAFFITRERLLPQDRDDSLDLYDARTDGGFPSPQNQFEAVCSGSECQGPPSPPPGLKEVGSETFDGSADRGSRACGDRRKAARRHALKAKRLEQRASGLGEANHRQVHRLHRLAAHERRKAKQARVMFEECKTRSAS